MKVMIPRTLRHIPLYLLAFGLMLASCSSNPVADSNDTSSLTPPEPGTMKISVGVESETPQINTPIEFESPERVAIFLEVTNATGYHIKTLMDGVPEDVVTTVLWDGSNEEGLMVPTGIYMFHLTYSDVSKWTPFKYVK